MPPEAYFITFERLSYDDPLIERHVELEWNQWYDDHYIADVSKALGAHTATRWRIVNPGAVRYAAIYEIAGSDGVRGFDRLRAEWPKWWASGRMHPRHRTAMSVLVRPMADFDPATGRMSRSRPKPGGSQRLSPRTKAINIIFVSSNDPAKEEEWNQWYMDVHTPEVIKTGGYVRATRCERVLPEAAGGNMELLFTHVTIYDIEMEPVELAGQVVSRHKEWEEKGLMHPNHTSTPMGFLFRPTGKWAGVGYKSL